jgi:hypothetical protein
MSIELPFKPGQLVIVVLSGPREKYWGSLLGLESAGIVQRGFELSQWEQSLSLAKGGEFDQVGLGTRFFPMHRVVSMYADEADSGAESLGDVFLRRVGIDPMIFLGTTYLISNIRI